MVESDPRHVESLNDLVNRILKRGNLEQSFRFLNMAAEANPEYPDTYNNLGKAYTKTGETEKAIRAYRKTLSLDPGNEKALQALKKLQNIQKKDNQLKP